MSLLCNSLYIISLIIFLLYFLLKVVNNKILFSPFNISLYMYVFDIFIMPIFFTNDRAWYALGISDASSMIPYLQNSMIINFVGFIVMMISLYYFEFLNKNKKIEHFIIKIAKKINIGVLDYLTILLLIVWYIVVFIYNDGGLPLMNGNRTFYLNTSISSVYLALNSFLNIIALYYGIKWITEKRKFVFFIVTSLTVLFQGNRGAFIINIVATVFIFYIYFKKKKRNDYDKYYKVMMVKQNIKMIRILSLLLILGIILTLIRNKSAVSFDEIINELIYGNTFSDIRDGAFVLKGFVENTNSSYIYGKTIWAGLISFIPSSIFTFRANWSWGNYSTNILFGMANHTGLRGGNSMEAYVNFGYIGVIVFSIIYGYFFGKLECWFNNSKKNMKNIAAEFIVVQLITSFYSLFICSASFYSFYVVVILLFFLSFFHKRNKKVVFRL